MIVGNIIALAGFHALPEVRAAAPYLVPLHVAFYLLHLLQEQGLILRNQRHAKVAAEAATTSSGRCVTRRRIAD